MNVFKNIVTVFFIIFQLKENIFAQETIDTLPGNQELWNYLYFINLENAKIKWLIRKISCDIYEEGGCEQKYHIALSTIAKEPEQNLEIVRLVKMYTSFTQEFFPVIKSY